MSHTTTTTSTTGTTAFGFYNGYLRARFMNEDDAPVFVNPMVEKKKTINWKKELGD